VHVSNELYRISKQLMLHSYELTGKCCTDLPKVSHGCSKVYQVATKFDRVGAKFSQVGPKLLTDAS
jgi:hypothetical protein